MKCKFLVACLLVGLLFPRAEAATDFYVNDGVVVAPPDIPPQVDATNFVNNNYFSINFTNLFFPQLYETDNTLNFTNNGIMIANTGFRFNWFGKTNISGMKGRRMAANFENTGTISSGSGGNTNAFFGLFLLQPGLPKLQVSATNINLRSSTNIVGVDGLLSLTGKKVDLNRATLTMEGFEENPDSLFTVIDTVGMSAAYWGIGTNVMNPVGNFEFPPPTTPFHLVNTPGGGLAFRSLQLPGAAFYYRESIFGTNRILQAVFLGNTNAAIENSVFFPNTSTILVEWLGRQTNTGSGVVTTNRMYLTDRYGNLATNQLFGIVSYYSANATAIPANYDFTRFNPFIFGAGPVATLDSPSGRFDNLVVTNDFAAFGASFSPTTVALNDLPPSGRYLTNLPGRLEITAEETLDLRFSRILGLNYMGLKSTNHVVGTGGASISVPFSDISLGTTNGHFAVTNLVAPTVQRFAGEVDLWSGRWTNDAGGFRTLYTVLFVDSRLSPNAPSVIQDLTLRSTNLVISDIMNVTRNLMLNAERVTITTNQQPAQTFRGEINLSSAITWSTSTPRLQYLTNNGGISALNAVFLGGSRSSPFYSSNFNEPYIAFVNRGTVTTEGSLIWADYFENSGSFDTRLGFGSIALQSQDTRLTNGSFVAINGNISIGAANLIVTNHLLQAGRKLSLSVSNSISDTGASNANHWVVGRGFDLPVKAVTGDLLGTTIVETAPPGVENVHAWAGDDRGAVPGGFQNNTALGRLTLDGSSSVSLFTFTGTGTSNALYVDYLELRNFATNINAGGNLSALNVEPNMVVYYAQAVAGGVSVAERLDFSNDGRLRWVPGYAGIYSATNVVYADGSTNLLNTALVESQNLDSDGDGVVNAADSTPVFLVTTTSLPDATNSVAYSVPLVAFGGPAAAPYSWTLVSGAGLPAGLSLSPAGVVSGTPTETGVFAFTVRASVVTPGGVLTADREVVLTVQASTLALALALESGFSPSARVSWVTSPNSTNYVYFRSSLAAGNWQLLTNFVSSTGGAVSVWDPVGTNKTRSYRVQVDSPKP